MPEQPTRTTADLKAAWSHELTAALQRDGIVPLTSSPDHSPMLTARYTEILGLAESRFGPRDTSYTILGVEFINDDPRIWYPGSCGQTVVQLGKPCLVEPERACFQLAHETIHLLDPTTKERASVLEEGLATHFQVWYMAEHYPSDWPRSGIDWTDLPKSYSRARSSVECLLEIDPDAIRRLRGQQLALSQITAQQIQGACPSLPTDVARALATRFQKPQSQGSQAD